MQTKLIKQTLAQTYLTIVPIAALIIAFAIGHVSYKIYIPISIINVCLMETACRIYLTISFLGFSIMLLSFVEPLATVSDIVSIPAIPFLMPYFMGINLLGMKKLTSASNE